MNRVASLLLVHGAWHGPWAWQSLVEQLPDIDIHTVSLPSSGNDAAALGDLYDDAAEQAVGRLGLQAWASTQQPLTQAAWHTIPSTYIVCEADNALPPFAQELMAKRAERVLRMNSSHSPFLSQPSELAALISGELSA